MIKKVAYLVFMILLFSCEKDECKLCKIKSFVPGYESVITMEIVCYDITEGYLISFDTLNRETLRMVKCEHKK